MVKTERFGKEVWLSEVAEQGRKAGCLCIHEENGKKVICRRLQNNLALQDELAHLGRELAMKRLKELAVEAFKDMAENGVNFEKYSENFVCPTALVNYINCVVSGTAFATAWCPGYLPPEEKGE